MAEGAFAEWAEYAGHSYGTAHTEIDRARADGRDLLFDVDVVGAANLKRSYPDAVSLFILPPSWAELERRLRARATDGEDAIARRLSCARGELSAARTFDYLVLNDDLERAFGEMSALYSAARIRTSQRLALLDRLQRSE